MKPDVRVDGVGIEAAAALGNDGTAWFKSG
jgi:hypothetical protein